MLRTASLLGLLLAAVTALALLPLRFNAGGHTSLTMAVWGMPFEDLLFRDVYARGFEKAHPNYRVNYQRYVEVRDKYNAWHVLGRGADVMRLPITDYHDMVRKGAIEPLDRFINDPVIGIPAGEQADFLPFIWSQLDISGKRYALPSDNAQYGLFYNRDLFDDYNSTHPDSPLSYPSDAWDWQDLADAAQRLTLIDDNGHTTQYGIAFDLWAWPFMAFLVQAGGELWDSSRMSTLIGTEPGIEAMQFLGSLVPSDLRMSAGQPTESGLKAEALFKAGRLAMMFDGSWRVPNVEIDRPDLNFAVAPLPSHRRQAVVTGSVLWVISAHSGDKEGAWLLARWLTNRGSSLAYWNTLRVAPPARESVITSMDFRRTKGLVLADGTVKIPGMALEKFDDRAAWLSYALGIDPLTGRMRGFVPSAPYQRELEDRIAQAIIRTVRREMTAREALAAATDEVHAAIDRDRQTQGLPPVVREN